MNEAEPLMIIAGVLMTAVAMIGVFVLKRTLDGKVKSGGCGGCEQSKSCNLKP